MVGILVLADTHVRRCADLPEVIHILAQKADLIIHAGDLTHGDVLSELERLADVVAVKGNMDVFTFSVDLPKTRAIELERVKIGVTHGSGSPSQALDRARSTFQDRDLIIFGHSHQPLIEEVGGTVMFNPGSSTDHRCAPFPTYGWLSLEAGRFQASLHQLDGEMIASREGGARYWQSY